jgi:hypothetical protein
MTPESKMAVKTFLSLKISLNIRKVDMTEKYSRFLIQQSLNEMFSFAKPKNKMAAEYKMAFLTVT